MNTLKSVCNMTLLDQDESYAQKQLSFSGLDSIIQLYMLLFSGVADIPATRLWGQAASGLNATGEGDQLNYDSRVEADRAGRITDALRDLDTVLIPSALGSIPEGYSWYWPPLQDADDTAETAREKTDAETDVMLIKSGVVTADQAAARVLNTKRYPTMDQAYVDTLRSALEETPSTDEPDGTV
jgi:phage-related protein (TIGR01555 family)